MNPIIPQNMTMGYPNMMNFALSNASNQFSFHPQQAQRMIYPYLINNNLTQPQVQSQLQNIYNMNNIANSTNQISQNNAAQISQNSTNTDNLSSKIDSNNLNNNAPNCSAPFKLLTKYKDIYVPSIYLMDYNDTTKSPFNIIIASTAQAQPQAYNHLTGQVINNNQNNAVLNKYFNYGYNLEQWKAYVNDIKSKFDELN